MNNKLKIIFIIFSGLEIFQFVINLLYNSFAAYLIFIVNDPYSGYSLLFSMFLAIGYTCFAFVDTIINILLLADKNSFNLVFVKDKLIIRLAGFFFLVIYLINFFSNSIGQTWHIAAALVLLLSFIFSIIFNRRILKTIKYKK